MAYTATIRVARPVAIYLLIDGEGRTRWIGKSINTPARLKRHMVTKPWIVSCPIVDWADETNWVEREKAWIARGRAEGWPLENKASGGQGSGGFVMPREAVERTRAAKLGRPLTLEQKAKLRAAWVIRKARGPEKRCRRGGYTLSLQTRLKISALAIARCEPRRLVVCCCGTEFSVVASRIANGRGKFCRARCYHVHMKKECRCHTSQTFA